MRNLLTALVQRKLRTCRKSHDRRPTLEILEDRLTPAGNILVSTDGPAAQQLLQEFTPAGSLVRSVAIPPGGPAEDARDLVSDPSGNVLVFNGTNDPYLSTYAGGSWSQATYPGWSTVNTVGYGGI